MFSIPPVKLMYGGELFVVIYLNCKKYGIVTARVLPSKIDELPILSVECSLLNLNELKRMIHEMLFNYQRSEGSNYEKVYLDRIMSENERPLCLYQKSKFGLEWRRAEKAASNRIFKTHDALPAFTMNEIDPLRRFTDLIPTVTTNNLLQTSDTELQMLNFMFPTHNLHIPP
uniref:Tudor domain-containing protein n=1 Tax=Strongyloides papillosus TaxID=174720 RepID=A0A0N5BLG0_STREA